jgi:hypothetical protein
MTDAVEAPRHTVRGLQRYASFAKVLKLLHAVLNFARHESALTVWAGNKRAVRYLLARNMAAHGTFGVDPKLVRGRSGALLRQIRYVMGSDFFRGPRQTSTGGEEAVLVDSRHRLLVSSARTSKTSAAV